MIPDPLSLFGRDADDTQLCLGLTGQHLYLAPDVELVLKIPDVAHLRQGIAAYHRCISSVT